jgi:hypothetical protein
MNRKLSNWASIAEVLGAIAIVISLVFVGIQISNGNREARAATTQAALDAEMTFLAEVIAYADIWQEVVIGGDFSDEIDSRRGVALYNMGMTMNENIYRMANEGYIDDYSTQGLEQIVNFPIFDTWRATPGAAARSQRFLELLDELREQSTAD